MGETQQTHEDLRLGGSSPFVTIMKLCIGPLLFAFINGIQDSIDLFIIKKGFGQRGATIVSISSGLRTLSVTLSGFCIQGMMIKTSELLTKHEPEKAGKLLVEAFRFSIILGLTIPLLLLSTLPKLLPVLGMPKEYKLDAIKYLCPAFLVSFVFFMNAVFNAVYMAMGRSILSASFQLVSLLISLLFDPIHIWILKLDVPFLGLAFISGPTLICIIQMILFFTGRYSVKPFWSAFKAKPTSDFWDTMKLSSLTVTTVFVTVFCQFFVVGIFTRASKNIHQENILPTVFATSTKVYTITVLCIAGALSGVIPSTTWAFHNSKMRRFTKLVLYSLVLPFMLLAIIWPIMVFFPKIILRLWIDNEEMLAWVPKISPMQFYSMLVEPISNVMSLLLVVLKRPLLTVIGMVVKNLVVVGGAIAIFVTVKDNPRTVLFCYVIQDAAYLIYCIIAFSVVFKKAKHQMEQSTLESALLSSIESVENK